MGIANGTETVIVLCLQLLYDTLFYFVYAPSLNWIDAQINAAKQRMVCFVQLPSDHGMGPLLHSSDHVLLL